MEPLKLSIPPDYTETSKTRHSALASSSKKIFTNISNHPDAGHAATLMGTMAEGIDYAHGGEPPLEANRFEKIKVGLKKIQTGGISGEIVLNLFTQSVTTFQVYASLYEAIKDVPIKDYLPLNGFLFPLSSLYRKGEDLLSNIEAWQKAKQQDEKTETGMKLAGNIASCLLYTIQIFAFLSATKVAIELQTILKTISFSSSLFDFLNAEYNTEVSQEISDKTPPTLKLRV